MKSMKKALIVLLSLGCISSMQAEDFVRIHIINTYNDKISVSHKSGGQWHYLSGITPDKDGFYNINTGKDHRYSAFHNTHGGDKFKGKTTWNIRENIIS